MRYIIALLLSLSSLLNALVISNATLFDGLVLAHDSDARLNYKTFSSYFINLDDRYTNAYYFPPSYDYSNAVAAYYMNSMLIDTSLSYTISETPSATANNLSIKNGLYYGISYYIKYDNFCYRPYANALFDSTSRAVRNGSSTYATPSETYADTYDQRYMIYAATDYLVATIINKNQGTIYERFTCPVITDVDRRSKDFLTHLKPSESYYRESASSFNTDGSSLISVYPSCSAPTVYQSTDLEISGLDLTIDYYLTEQECNEKLYSDTQTGKVIQTKWFAEGSFYCPSACMSYSDRTCLSESAAQSFFKDQCEGTPPIPGYKFSDWKKLTSDVCIDVEGGTKGIDFDYVCSDNCYTKDELRDSLREECENSGNYIFGSFSASESALGCAYKAFYSCRYKDSDPLTEGGNVTPGESTSQELTTESIASKYENDLMYSETVVANSKTPYEMFTVSDPGGSYSYTWENEEVDEEKYTPAPAPIDEQTGETVVNQSTGLPVSNIDNIASAQLEVDKDSRQNLGHLYNEVKAGNQKSSNFMDMIGNMLDSVVAFSPSQLKGDLDKVVGDSLKDGYDAGFTQSAFGLNKYVSLPSFSYSINVRGTEYVIFSNVMLSNYLNDYIDSIRNVFLAIAAISAVMTSFGGV